MNKSRQQLVDRVVGWWFKPHDLLYFQMYEFLICSTMLYYFGGYLSQVEWWIGDMAFHASAEATSSHYLPPPTRPSSEWFGWIKILFYTLGIAYLLGFGRRILNWVFFGLCVYVQAMDQPTAFTINRMLIIYFLMLALRSPATQIVNEDGRERSVVSGWMVRIIQLTLTVQYTASGFCKMNGDWLERADIIWTQSQGHYKNLISAWAVNDLPMPFWWLLAGFTLAFETLAVITFFWKRTRVWTIISGFLMHIGIAILMKDLIYFSVQMMTAYVFFFPEHWLTKIRTTLIRWLPPVLTRNL